MLIKVVMTMVPPTNGYARDLEQGKAGSVVLYHGTVQITQARLYFAAPLLPLLRSHPFLDIAFSLQTKLFPSLLPPPFHVE